MECWEIWHVEIFLQFRQTRIDELRVFWRSRVCRVRGILGHAAVSGLAGVWGMSKGLGMSEGLGIGGAVGFL